MVIFFLYKDKDNNHRDDINYKTPNMIYMKRYYVYDAVKPVNKHMGSLKGKLSA